MTITHQILTDAEGKPVAAQIPWDEFRELQKFHAEIDEELPLTDEYRAELERRLKGIRSGTTTGVSSDTVMSNLRNTLNELDQKSA